MTPEVEAEFVEAVKWLDAKGVEVSSAVRSPGVARGAARVVGRATSRGAARREWWNAPPHVAWRGVGGGTPRRPPCVRWAQRASVVESFNKTTDRERTRAAA